MIKIRASGQTIGSGRVAFIGDYVSGAHKTLAQTYYHSGLQLKQRGIDIDGDIRFLLGSARTEAEIEFRFIGDCICYDINGSMRLGARVWACLLLATALKIAEAWLGFQHEAAATALSLCSHFLAALFAWYILTHPLVAWVVRSRIVEGVHEACISRELHENTEETAPDSLQIEGRQEVAQASGR